MENEEGEENTDVQNSQPDTGCTIDAPRNKPLAEKIAETVEYARKNSRRPKFWIGLAKFLAPFAIAAAVIALMWVSLPTEKAAKLSGVMATYMFTPIGRFVVLTGPALSLTVWEIVLAVVFVDMMASLFVVWNFDLILGIPWLGDKLRKAVQSAHNFLFRWKWLRGLAFLGIIIFVSVPVTGTNAIVGSILGRIIGMSRTTTYISVGVGAFMGAFLMALPVYGIKMLF